MIPEPRQLGFGIDGRRCPLGLPGRRAQAGIADLLRRGSACPFPIITGTSAGAVSAIALASDAAHFRRSIYAIERVWRDFRVHHVFKADALSMVKSGLHWFLGVSQQGLAGAARRISLFDNAPLWELLRTHLHFDGIPRSLYNGDRIRVVAQRDPTKLPWAELGVDYVLECTGLFTSKAKAAAHLTAGAKKVVISAPGGEDVDATIVYGVNDDILTSGMTVISNASCTTNCLVPLVKVLHEKVGVLAGVMTTIHSYTNDQVLTDVYHTDLRRARSATMSMIPAKTGAAAAVGLVLPELKGKIDGFAIRVPTINVSLVDLSFTAARKTSAQEIHDAVKAAANGSLKGILAYNDQPLVSVDFNHDPASSTYDATLTKVMEGTLVKVCSWYDNEWGFSNRMLDTTLAWSKAK